MSKGSRILCAGTLALLALGGGSARAQRLLTLDEALAIAKRNNRDMAQAKARVDEAHAGVAQALSALLPTVAAQGKYTHNYREVILNFSDTATLQSLQGKLSSDVTGAVLAGAQASGATTIADQIGKDLQAIRDFSTTHPSAANGFGSGNVIVQRGEQLDFVLSGTIPLLVPWAYPMLNAARATEDAGRANQAVTEATVLLATAQAYYAAAGADEVVEARLHAIAVQQKALDNAKARLEAGVVNRVEVTRAELQLLRSQQALLETQDQQAAGYRALATIMNMHEPVHVQPGGELAQRDEDPQALADGALRLRPEFPALKKTIDSYRLTANANLWRWAPTVSAFGNLRAFNTPGFSGDNYAWAVGLQLDWVLYDGGVRDAQRALATAQRRENEAKLDLLRDQVRDDVLNAERALKTKRSALETAKRSVQLSKDTLDLVQVQHDAGTATQLDLLTAQDNLVAAEVAVAQARFDLSQGALQLQRLAGTFPGNLNLK
jgi:outer membrane protein TolC